MSANPFFSKSTLEYELPPFSQINDDHYLPAFYAGMEAQRKEVNAIVDQPDVTFDNTIVSLEKSGQLLTRVANVFYNKSSSDTNDAIDAIEAEIAPKLAAHSDAIKLNAPLFSRIQKLMEKQGSLSEEDAWILKKYYEDFVYAGAELSEESREHVKRINEELSSLQTTFAKNLLSDTNDLAVFVSDPAELDGLSDNQIAACKAAAEARGIHDKWMIGMVNFTGHSLLRSLKNRNLREKVMAHSLQKGLRGNSHDTQVTLLRMVALRTERAKLFGLSNHAEYVLRQQTAGSLDNVHAMLKKIAPAALENARREGADIQRAIDKEASQIGRAHV